MEEGSVGQCEEVQRLGDSGTAEHQDGSTGEHRRWTAFRTEWRAGAETRIEVLII